MAGDVRLDGDWVILEGKWFRLRGWDLMLDSPDRRSAPDGWRRALVHDPADGLTINWAADYPGGVTIFGPVRIMGSVAGSLKLDLAKVVYQISPLDEEPRRRGTGTSLDGGTYRERLVIGDDSRDVELQGAEVHISGDIYVSQNARFTSAVRALDFEITGPAGPDLQPAPRSIAQALDSLRAGIEALEARVSALEGTP